MLAQKTIDTYGAVHILYNNAGVAHPGNNKVILLQQLDLIAKSFIVDNQLSEKYYLIALEREQKHHDIYYGLFELYRYSFNDPQKAIEVLERGRQNNPDQKVYVVDLIDYYLVLDQKDKANQVLDEWLKEYPDDFSLRERIEKK